MADIDGYSITLARYAIAVIGLVLILAWREGIDALLFDGHGKRVVAAGAIGMAGSGLLVFTGLSLTRPEVTVIIIALQPAMTAVAQWIFRDRRPSGVTIACLIAAFLGVAYVVTGGGHGLSDLLRSSPQELLGNLMVLLGGIAWVGYSLLVERLHGWSSLRIATMSCVTASATIVIVWLPLLAMGMASIPDPAKLLEHSWRLGYLGVLGVTVAMILWNVGSRRIGPLNAMLMVNLMPIFTFGMRALQGETIRKTELIGAAIVVSALLANNAYLRWVNRPVAIRP